MSPKPTVPDWGITLDRPPSGNSIRAVTSDSVKMPDVFIRSSRTAKNSLRLLIRPSITSTPGIDTGGWPGAGDGTRSSKITISCGAGRGTPPALSASGIGRFASPPASSSAIGIATGTSIRTGSPSTVITIVKTETL